MGTWNWNDVPDSLNMEIVTAPHSARLAASIVPSSIIDEAFEAGVQYATGLPQLAIEEWSVSAEVEGIFELLRLYGSEFGYVVESVGDGQEPIDCLKIALTSDNAIAIARDSAMDMPMAFIDDQQLCSLISYHDDYALIGMRGDIFDRWLVRVPLDLTLRPEGPRYSIPNTFDEAKIRAQRRNAEWAKLCRQNRRD